MRLGVASTAPARVSPRTGTGLATGSSRKQPEAGAAKSESNLTVSRRHRCAGTRALCGQRQGGAGIVLEHRPTPGRPVSSSPKARRASRQSREPPRHGPGSPRRVVAGVKFSRDTGRHAAVMSARFRPFAEGKVGVRRSVRLAWPRAGRMLAAWPRCRRALEGRVPRPRQRARPRLGHG